MTYAYLLLSDQKEFYVGSTSAGTEPTRFGAG
jgi:hypothetical protein